jgi:hypothetical protein
MLIMPVYHPSRFDSSEKIRPIRSATPAGSGRGDALHGLSGFFAAAGELHRYSSASEQHQGQWPRGSLRVAVKRWHICGREPPQKQLKNTLEANAQGL